MKTKIFGGIAIVAIAVAVALNVNMVNKKSERASLLALANVEALAGGEVTFPWCCRNDCSDVCIVDDGFTVYGTRVW